MEEVETSLLFLSILDIILRVMNISRNLYDFRLVSSCAAVLDFVFIHVVILHVTVLSVHDIFVRYNSWGDLGPSAE